MAWILRSLGAVAVLVVLAVAAVFLLPAEKIAGVALGKLETWYGKLFNNSNANFYFTRRHENHPWFSLIGAIANSDGVDAKGILLKPETFLIGHGCTYTPKRSGYFYAYANDAWNCYENNKGHVALTIQ